MVRSSRWTPVSCVKCRTRPPRSPQAVVPFACGACHLSVAAMYTQWSVSPSGVGWCETAVAVLARAGGSLVGLSLFTDATTYHTGMSVVIGSHNYGWSRLAGGGAVSPVRVNTDATRGSPANRSRPVAISRGRCWKQLSSPVHQCGDWVGRPFGGACFPKSRSYTA